MSTSYYITNKTKEKEYRAFADFWDNQLMPELLKSIEGYCSSTAGEYVNEDTTEDIWEHIKYRLPFCPLNEENCGSRFGAYTNANGFRWDHITVDRVLIYSLKSLSEFLAQHPDYCIQDECSEDISLEEFRAKTHL